MFKLEKSFVVWRIKTLKTCKLLEDKNVLNVQNVCDARLRRRRHHYADASRGMRTCISLSLVSLCLSVCLSVCRTILLAAEILKRTHQEAANAASGCPTYEGRYTFFILWRYTFECFEKKYFNFLRLCLCGTTPVVKLLQLWCLILRWGRNAACLNSTLLYYYPPCIQMSVWGTSVQIILQSLLLRNCFKVSTIVLLLLILLKKPIFITNCNVCYSDLY